MLLLSTVFVLVLSSSLFAQIPQSEYSARRDSLAARVGDGVILVLGEREPEHDYLAFFQSPHFLYLTGIREPNAALVLVKRGSQVRGTVFVQPRDPASEVWTGPRMGTEGAARRTGLGASGANELIPMLDSLAAAGQSLYVVGDFGAEEVLSPGERGLSADQELVQSLLSRHSRLELRDATSLVRRMRGRKSPAELELIRQAADISVAAQREAMRAIEPEMNEFEVQALVEFTFRRNGADRPSFASIIGSGPNATTLHYNANDRVMRTGELVLMDIGASYKGYAADVTRTVPVNGTFSPEQRAIYQLVRDAQAAAERQAKVGAPAQPMTDSAVTTIERGLAKLGLIDSVGALVAGGEAICGEPDAQCPQWVMYFMHGLGHGIGLDVHDPEQSLTRGGKIARGSAYTIEPGVYIRANLLEIIPDSPRNRAMIVRIRPALERYAGLGVRIEDDYIVTERGVEWISRAPREIGEIEALMKEQYAGPMRRDPAVVRKYETTGERR